MNVDGGQSPDLISFTPEVEQVPQKSPQNPLEDVNSDLPKPATQKNYSRLCGYLNKVGNRGILKTIRKRWFVFSEDRCKLYYYRSSQDLVPLGAIDISQATFSFDVSNKEKAGTFVISVPDKKFHLEASDRQTCLFWLQELQKFRRTNSLQRTELIRGRSGSHSSFEKPSYGGLLGNSSFSANSIDCSKEETLLMDPVDCPGGSIGETVPETSNKPLLIAQQKFSNLRNQVLNSVNAIRQDKNSSETQNIPVNGSMFSQEKRLSGYSLQNSTFFDNLPTDTCTIETSCPNETCPPSPKKNQGLSAIRTKISESFRKQKCSEEEEPTAVRKPSKKYSCSACRDNTKTIQLLQNEISSLQDEVSVSRSLIKTLQKQLDIVLKEKETIIHLRQMDDASDMLEILNSKDHEIINLRHDIQEQKQEVENLQKQILSIKHSLQEKTDLYQELLQQKDSQIIMLTNEVFDLESEKRDQECKQKHSNSTSSLNGSKSSECLKDLDDSENLKDAVQAYELQNKFLNKELLELNQLRSDAEQREYVLTLQCNEWEARCCQIQSKFLYLLKELEKPDSNEKSQELVSRLLREATADNADSSEFHPSWAIEKVYDDLGFNYKWGKEDLLSTKAANLKQRSDDIANKAKQESETVLLRAKWDNFMVTVGNKELQLTPELKLLLRQGIPHEYKGRIWKGCVEMRIKFLKLKLGEGYYDKLVYSEEYVSRLDPSSKQIELDLLRTLPNNQHYEDLDADGIPKLRRVLLAYSRHDPIVGYCQGLNRLAAIALLFLEEEDAFWCLITIIKYLMPEGYYSRSLMAAQVDQRVLKELMSDKLPRLHSHLDQYKVDLSLFTFNWFLTIFIDNIPIETSLRIWDVFLFEGSKVLFRYALAFFKICEADVLALKDYIVINKYLRTIAETMTDVKRLHQIAFSELNPFPQRVINAKRAQHTQIVKAELEELEKLRNSLPRNVEKCVSPDCLSEED